MGVDFLKTILYILNVFVICSFVEKKMATKSRGDFEALWMFYQRGKKTGKERRVV